mgnify:CR=1 FL=1
MTGHQHRSEDEILLRALGEADPVGGETDGGRGTPGTAKPPRTNVHRIDLDLPMPVEESAERILEILADAGRLLDPGHSPQSAQPGQRTVRAVIEGGFGRLNRVLLTVSMVATGPESTSVTVRGAAKEGLLRRRAGEKTARLLADLLTAS